MVPGEGAAILVLERRERALARGARIYAELVGYGLTCDANHMTAPQGDGADARDANRDGRRRRSPSDEIGYISAHGTGTTVNDRVETAAVKQAFGDAAYRVPMSSIKSMLGHTMGAASAIEAAACTLAVPRRSHPADDSSTRRRIPSAISTTCPTRRGRCRWNVAMNNAYAFGGNNASVIFRKHRP